MNNTINIFVKGLISCNAITECCGEAAVKTFLDRWLTCKNPLLRCRMIPSFSLNQHWRYGKWDDSPSFTVPGTPPAYENRNQKLLLTLICKNTTTHKGLTIIVNYCTYNSQTFLYIGAINQISDNFFPYDLSKGCWPSDNSFLPWVNVASCNCGRKSLT